MKKIAFLGLVLPVFLFSQTQNLEISENSFNLLKKSIIVSLKKNQELEKKVNTLEEKIKDLEQAVLRDDREHSFKKRAKFVRTSVVRESPSFEGTYIRKAYKNEDVNVTAIVKNSWYRLEDDFYTYKKNIVLIDE